MSRPVLRVACVLLLAGCASMPKVQTDHDPSVDFGRFHTYAWRQEPPISNPLVRQRVVAAIDAQLQAKGWRPAAEPAADIALVGNVATRQEQTLDVFYGGPAWGDWGWRGGWGIGAGYRTARVHTYTVGTLVLDMFDTRTRQAVWRGTAEGTVPDSPARVDAAVQSAVTRMFEAFPPQAAARP